MDSQRSYEYRLVQTSDSCGPYQDGPLHFVFTSLVALRRRVEYVRGTRGRVRIKPKAQRREVGPWMDWKDADDV